MLKAKLALSVLALAVLSACSSSGGGSGSSGNPDNPNRFDNAGNGPNVKIYGDPTPGISMAVSDIKNVQLNDLQDEIKELRNADFSKADYTLTVDNKTFKAGDTIDVSNYLPKNKIGDVKVAHTVKNITTTNGGKYEITENTLVRGYRQDYSVVAGYRMTGWSSNISAVGSKSNFDDTMSINLIKGQATDNAALPTTGSFDYKGIAFSQNEKNGVLNYNVDFNKRVGSGTITGIVATGDITLTQSPIVAAGFNNSEWDGKAFNGVGIGGTATSTKNSSAYYQLGFFGPRAEEITGAVYGFQEDIGFAGKR